MRTMGSKQEMEAACAERTAATRERLVRELGSNASASVVNQGHHQDCPQSPKGVTRERRLLAPARPLLVQVRCWRQFEHSAARKSPIP